MKLNRHLTLFLCTLAAVCTARATTVIPPTFDELVGHADTIFQGTVTGSESQWTGEGAQRHIVTYVTFNVEDAIKGNPGASYTLRMLGGTVDGLTMEVTDTPKFKVGDREILFVENNGTQFIPLVGIMHGRFHLNKDAATGTDKVLTNGGQAVTDLKQLGKENLYSHADEKSNGAQTSAATPSLDASSFKAAIRSKLAESK